MPTFRAITNTVKLAKLEQIPPLKIPAKPHTELDLTIPTKTYEQPPVRKTLEPETTTREPEMVGAIPGSTTTGNTGPDATDPTHTNGGDPAVGRLVG